MDINLMSGEVIAEMGCIIAEQEQVEVAVIHHHAKDLYGREAFIPKGMRLAGKIHRYETINILVSGDMTIWTETGRKRIRPPFVAVSPPGTKRVGYAHEDSIWLCVHGTKETDLDKIEEDVIAKDNSDPLLIEEIKRLSL